MARSCTAATALLACALLACLFVPDVSARMLAEAPAQESDNRVFGPVLSVNPEGGDLDVDLTSYDLACPNGQYMTGLDIRGNNFNVDRSEAPDGKAPVIAAIGSLFCSGGAEVGYKVPLTVVRTEKWSPRAPKNVGYSGINLRTGLVIDALGLELTNGAVQPEGAKPAFFGGQGGSPRSLQCPPGYWITGLYGQTTEDRVASIGLRCREKA